MRKPIDVFARLSLISGDNTEIKVHADKDIVAVVIPNLRAAWQLFGQFPFKNERSKTLIRVQNGLQLGDLKVHFRIAHLKVAQLTPQSQGGLFSRWLGLSPLELYPLAIVRSLFASL